MALRSTPTLNLQPRIMDPMPGKEQWEMDAEDEMREHDRKKMRQDTLKCIKGKTLSEAKELVFVIKHEMNLNCFRKLH